MSNADFHIVLNYPQWKTVTSDRIHALLGVAGPDVFTPSSEMVMIASYEDETAGGVATVIKIAFQKLPPNHKMPKIDNWNALFGTSPIPPAIQGAIGAMPN